MSLHSNLQMIDSKGMMELFHFSKATLWRYVNNETIPAPIYIGRNALWHRTTIEAWLKDNYGVEVPTETETKRDISELC